MSEEELSNDSNAIHEKKMALESLIRENTYFDLKWLIHFLLGNNLLMCNSYGEHVTSPSKPSRVPETLGEKIRSNTCVWPYFLWLPFFPTFLVIPPSLQMYSLLDLWHALTRYGFGFLIITRKIRRKHLHSLIQTLSLLQSVWRWWENLWTRNPLLIW